MDQLPPHRVRRETSGSQPSVMTKYSTTLVRLISAVMALLGLATLSPDGSAQTSSIASPGLTPGWATFGLAVPQGSAATGLQVGNLPTQANVKNR